MVTLSASADPGSHFDGWLGGGCQGTGNCQIALLANTTCPVLINLQRPCGASADITLENVSIDWS